MLKQKWGDQPIYEANEPSSNEQTSQEAKAEKKLWRDVFLHAIHDYVVVGEKDRLYHKKLDDLKKENPKIEIILKRLDDLIEASYLINEEGAQVKQNDLRALVRNFNKTKSVKALVERIRGDINAEKNSPVKLANVKNIRQITVLFNKLTTQELKFILDYLIYDRSETSASLNLDANTKVETGIYPNKMRNWFDSTSKEPGSFLFLCTMFDLVPSAVRRKVKKMRFEDLDNVNHILNG